MYDARKPVNVYQASDYAGMDAANFSFYYGYEYGRTVTAADPDDEEWEWGFRYKRLGQVLFEVSYSEMAKHAGCPDQFECAECVMFGLGLYLMTL